MRYFFILVSAVWLILAGSGVTPAFAAGPPRHEVQPGDTLFSIANRYGLSVDELAWANGLGPNGWLYPGQQLVIPASAYAPAVDSLLNRPALAAPPAWNTPSQWADPNLVSPSWASYPSQPPDFYNSAPVQPVSAFPGQPNAAWTPNANRQRWIDVDLTRQFLTAYEGQAPVFTSLVSSGLWQYPTVVGTFQIYVKYELADMSGGAGEDAYYLPNVPYAMYFHGNYSLHGTYWHSNFGQPMSHGCVNLPTPAAEWLFHWAPLGTQVVTHY